MSRPKFFMDGTPIPDDYFDVLNSYMSDALDAEEQFTTEELEQASKELENAAKMEKARKENKE